MHTFRQPRKLVTSGIYRLSRNPMYLGFLLLLTGIAICTNEALNLFYALAFLLVSHFWYIPIEERNAAGVFGAAYDDYRSRVRRWL
ncbi:isoprenylcysteine carboxylmethyltransferase family protein [Roseibium salinum]|nr:isoprenylcysteine carboxylmethyltransferase family protein [Roseibium salinum]